MPGRPSSAAAVLRIGLVYAALYGSTGVTSPFMGVWLKSRGLPPAAIGAVLALPLLARILTGPAIALWADRFRLRRTPVAALALAATLAALGLLPARGAPAVALAWFLSATALGACTPLVDALALRAAAEGGFAYASARAVGSAAYVAGNVLGGALIGAFGPDVVVVWVAASGVATAALARACLPPAPAPARAAARSAARGGLGALVRDRRFLTAILAAGLIQASHAYYYSFSALLWRGQGFAPALVGGLWGIGVAVEIVFLAAGEGLRRRLGPERLLLAGGLGAAARWTALAFRPPLLLVVPLQALHALSFTATFIASIQLVERLSAPANASAAQSLNASLYGGLLIGAATLAAGPLFAAAGAAGYGAMGLLAALGALLAARLLGSAPERGGGGL